MELPTIDHHFVTGNKGTRFSEASSRAAPINSWTLQTGGGGVTKDGIDPVGGEDLAVLLAERSRGSGCLPESYFCPFTGEVLGEL